MTNINQKIQELLDSARTTDFRAIIQIENNQNSLSRKHFIIGTILELRRLCEVHSVGIKFSEETIFIYNDKYWQRYEKELFYNFLSDFALKIGVPMFEAIHFHFLDELFTQFKLTFIDLGKFVQNENVKINLQNGTCEFTSNGIVIKPFDKNDNLTYILPFEYNEKATCPEFEEYLEYVLPEQNSRFALSEYISYCFVNNKALKLEKAAILIGNGVNGKSVLFEIISALFGKENITHYSLKNLTEERGIYRMGIQGKLLNYSSELGKNLETTIFKQLVSGEPVDARSLYKSPVTIENYARLMFNTNEMPTDIEVNDGFMRRFMIFRFGITIPENKRDPHLSKRIIKNELSGIFNWVIKGLNRLLFQQGFTESEKIKSELDKFKNSSDSVRQFIEEEGYEKSTENPLTLKTLYSSYKVFCLEFGLKPVSAKKLSDRLRNLGFESDRKNYGTVFYMKKGRN
jgi:putative DNA primase/helicase